MRTLPRVPSRVDRNICGPLAAPSGGPSAVPIPTNIPEPPRIPPPLSSAFPRLHAHIRGNSRTYGISGRPVQVGLGKPFSVRLQRACNGQAEAPPSGDVLHTTSLELFPSPPKVRTGSPEHSRTESASRGLGAEERAPQLGEDGPPEQLPLVQHPLPSLAPARRTLGATVAAASCSLHHCPSCFSGFISRVALP